MMSTLTRPVLSSFDFLKLAAPARRTLLIAALLWIAVALLAVNARAADSGGGSDTTLQAAIGSPTRPAQETARDRYRHPLQTLTFFGIEPGMTVVEIEPGGGWYTAILAPYLKPHGKYYAAVADQHSDGFRKKLADDPKLYSNVIITEFDPPTKLDIAPPGSADMVLTFRNVHNWMHDGDAQDVFNAMYKALKPGGILGVEEHRANPNAPVDLKASSGYVRLDYIVKLAEQAGFKLAGESEINANPRDDRNHPAGVWTLPPTLRLGNKDRDKYLAIGESDRMTLKFVKPVA
jgi:predicted methyltransferase